MAPLPPKKNRYITNNSGTPLITVVYEFAIKFKYFLLDSFNGVNINENKKPITIAVIDTAIVIRVAKNNSSPQPVFPNEISSI
jgi:hypothetical protein